VTSASHDPSERLSVAGSDADLGPPQQVRPSRRRLSEQGIAVVPPIGQHQHPRGQPGNELAGQLDLRGRVGADDGREDGVGAALGQRHHPGLGEGRLLALGHPGATEVLGVLGRVGHVEGGPVDGHQPTTGHPRPRRLGGGQGHRHLGEQLADGTGPESGPGLEDARLGRQRPRLVPTRRPREAVGQLGEDVLVGALGVEGHGDGEVHHHPGRQRAPTLLSPAFFGHDRIDHVWWEDPCQQPDRHKVRQPPVRDRLHPPAARHPTKLHQWNLN